MLTSPQTSIRWDPRLQRRESVSTMAILSLFAILRPLYTVLNRCFIRLYHGGYEGLTSPPHSW
jgi:hypothetical protein